MTTINPMDLMQSAGNQARRLHSRHLANDIVRRSEKLANLSDARLGEAGREIRWRAKAGAKLRQLLPEAFALVREASRRELGMLHYPVQLIGGIALFEGHVAEMQTGEGKTLTATAPAFLRGLPGRGCHVITVNDYLAQRDCELMGPVYRRLGLSVGNILTDMETDERRENYACDITYGTAKEFGFDFLRDRLRKGAMAEDLTWVRRGAHANAGEAPVQRGHYFALIDEADSILIDDARTPLIIGLTQPNDPATVNLYRWSSRATSRLQPDEDFVYEPDRRSAYLTDAGCRHVLLMAKPTLLNAVDTERIYSQVEKALTARFGFHLDRDYVIVDDKVIIVDESTGRLMEGRKWQDGLHQAVEAKEQIPITAASGMAAKVTVQSFFRRYAHVAGMTGTAVNARTELRQTYRMRVSVIPTHRPCIRRGLPPRIFDTQDSKRQAIVKEVVKLHQGGRAVLIGTPSVNASELLSAALSDARIPHQTLNARFHKQEAEIVASAGKAGRVTIATNMAGRGTDILLDQQVRDSGGLHIIATEMHTSARIDRQLVGRSARQGDPGSFQFFLSFEDELLRCLPPKRLTRVRSRLSPDSQGEVSRSWHGFFARVQRFLERQFRKQRKTLLKAEKTRNESYRRMGIDPYLELTET